LFVNEWAYEMSTLLITGGSGFVGRNLAAFFAPRWSVITTYLTQPDVSDATARSFQLDVRDAGAVLSAFERAAPDVVIHAAGNKNLRFCEDHPDEAHRVNALGTQNVARACRDFGASMIYLSTDLVFSGTKGGYREDELPRPTSAYGKSKLEGEKFALRESEDVAVCRSGGIYGKGSPLLNWLSAEIGAGRSVECFTDVFNTPTYVENLAEMMEAVIRKRLVGVFHTAGPERASRFEFFRSYASAFGLDAGLLSPVSIGGLKERLLLQPDSSLSVQQTSQRLGVAFDSLTEGFARLKACGGV
jgi:dTDP-4-dehydrorhamnose reductase